MTTSQIPLSTADPGARSLVVRSGREQSSSERRRPMSTDSRLAPRSEGQVRTDAPAPTERRRAWRPSTRIRLVSDLAIFVIFLALSAPTTTGLAVHEWLAIPFIPVFLGHLITSWPWVRAMMRHGARPKGRPRTNRALDVTLFVLMVTAIYSGFAISVEVLPFLGFDVVPSGFWVGVHSASSTLLIALIATHVFLHWPWVRRHVLRTKRVAKVVSE